MTPEEIQIEMNKPPSPKSIYYFPFPKHNDYCHICQGLCIYNGNEWLEDPNCNPHRSKNHIKNKCTENQCNCTKKEEIQHDS